MLPTIPLSLYVHTPWCIRKCPYCDFNSHALRQEMPEDAYIDTLIEDFSQRLPLLGGRPLQTLFIGGGTPSLLTPPAYQKLFRAINENYGLNKNIEISLEANPGTIDLERLLGYREIGINRLSIGIQSFQEEKLKSLGRIHDSATAVQAIQLAKRSGFDNINLDIMFGLPQQSVQEALDDLQAAIDLEPTHLSWYQLTLEPNTFFYKHPPRLPTDDHCWEIQMRGQALLQKHGFQQYEISAYCKDQRYCNHNVNYWEFGDYLGIGAGAHSKITERKTITRYWNIKSPRFYMDTDKPFIEGNQVVVPHELPLEFMMNALRLQKSIPLTLYRERTGLTNSSLKQALCIAESQGLLKWNSQEITVLPLGYRYLNELLTLF